jgi:nucleotide-binding universal stress UspA family protein
MSKRAIVVPLDGSELAERALPYAAEYAKALGARLLLVTVWEGADEALELVLKGVAEELFSTAEKKFEEYLFGVAKRIKDVPVDAEVLAGHPADEIVRLVAERDIEMLVLSSHGRSGLGRFWFGSVGSQLVRRAGVPRLVIGPEALEQTAQEIKNGRILVPLDGSELSEAALEPAKRFAKLFDAEIVVTQVLGWASHAFVFDVPPTTVADIDKELAKASKEYLAQIVERLGNDRPVRRSATRARRGRAHRPRPPGAHRSRRHDISRARRALACRAGQRGGPHAALERAGAAHPAGKLAVRRAEMTYRGARTRLLAVQHADGELIVGPPGSYELRLGDRLIMLTNESDMTELGLQLNARTG